MLVYKPDTRGRVAPEGGGLINRNNTTKGVIKCLLPLLGELLRQLSQFPSNSPARARSFTKKGIHPERRVMAKRKGTLRLRVDGWNDSESNSDEAAAQSENDAAAKKRKLSLSLMKKTRTDRFEFVDEFKTESLGKKLVPKNTDNNTKWAVSTFLLWRDKRNVSFKEPDYQVPEDLLISTDTALL